MRPTSAALAVLLAITPAVAAVGEFCCVSDPVTFTDHRTPAYVCVEPPYVHFQPCGSGKFPPIICDDGPAPEDEHCSEPEPVCVTYTLRRDHHVCVSLARIGDVFGGGLLA